jgi:hypothetical protein
MLTIIPSIRESSIQPYHDLYSRNKLSFILLVSVLELVSMAIFVFAVGYLGSWTEEVGCQAYGIMKRWVVRPVGY